MVSKEKINALIGNPRVMASGDVPAVESLLEKYPYFQALRAALLRYYKDRDISRYPDSLSLTAAQTADRGWLAEWLQIPWPEPQKPAPEKPEPASPEPAGSGTPPSETPPPSRLSYAEWVRYLQNHPKASAPSSTGSKSGKMEIIDRFLANPSRIKPRKDVSFAPPPEVSESIREKNALMTETLARLYVKQKKYAKAIQAYEILKLKYPEKNRYFAARIAEIKNLND